MMTPPVHPQRLPFGLDFGGIRCRRRDRGSRSLKWRDQGGARHWASVAGTLASRTGGLRSSGLVIAPARRPGSSMPPGRLRIVRASVTRHQRRPQDRGSELRGVPRHRCRRQDRGARREMAGSGWGTPLGVGFKQLLK
jgi:hypothetical protein